MKDTHASEPVDIILSTVQARAGLSEDQRGSNSENSKASLSCLLCRVSFHHVQEQRGHAKSDWHGYNLKQKLRGARPVTSGEFEKLIDGLDESISGSESSESGNDEQRDDIVADLLKKQARIAQTSAGDDERLFHNKPRGSGTPPLLWFSSPLLPSNTSLGVYKALFAKSELDKGSDIVDIIRHKQLSRAPPKATLDEFSNGAPLPSTMTSPHIFLCMIGGGHFAAMIVSLAPKVGKKPSGVEERQATVLAHKTFHRYTTRRKQGGAQSANDSAKGAAHSAGASIRRHNEAALESEVRGLLADWKDFIQSSQLVFVRATGNLNRRTLFGPYDGQVLQHNDPRNRSFPFSTRRATQAELMRAFVELTRMKVSRVDEAALAALAAARAEAASLPSKSIQSPTKPSTPKPSEEEQLAMLHTSQIQGLIRRSKASALLAYFAGNSIPPDFAFYPQTSQANHHAPTPLHLAASISSPAIVLALLCKGGANPTLPNGEAHPPFDLAGDRATRDAFRIARSEIGEDRWDWQSAHCPPPLSKAEVDKRREREKEEAEKVEAERRRVEMEKLKKDEAANADGKQPASRTRKAVEKTGAEKREEEARGLSPEMRMKVERERRARAAEERLRMMAGDRT